MEIKWEVERDGFRRTVNYVVDGVVEGYYYEDKSDPGVFPIWVYDRDLKDFKFFDVESSEKEAKNTLDMVRRALIHHRERGYY